MSLSLSPKDFNLYPDLAVGSTVTTAKGIKVEITTAEPNPNGEIMGVRNGYPPNERIVAITPLQKGQVHVGTDAEVEFDDGVISVSADRISFQFDVNSLAELIAGKVINISYEELISVGETNIGKADIDPESKELTLDVEDESGFVISNALIASLVKLVKAEAGF